MNKSGPVVIIEDNPDDKVIFAEIFKKLDYKNEIIFFKDGDAALEYLNKSDVAPFLILSDIKLPKFNGFELRQKIHCMEKLHLKCIPYLFFTPHADKKSVIDAYSMSVQGFFVKPESYEKLGATIQKIMEYWKECNAPSDYGDS